MRPPGFWQHDGVLPRILDPLATLVASSTARRVARPGWQAPVPVLCVGNAGLGGAGKTTVVLDLARRLLRRGVAVHCLSRGYGGRSRGVMRVNPAVHSAAEVGDEPLLLAEAAPTWVSADRAAAAQAAVTAGARALLMDDGLQNPSLVKTASLLVIDGEVGFGNGRVVPAGPLREPAPQAAARCRAGVLIGADRTGAACMLPGLEMLQARLVPDRRLDGCRVFAVSGIGRPQKFAAALVEAGADLAGTAWFPDHHPFTRRELRRLLDRAASLDARPITTPKDAARLPHEALALVDVLGVALAWQNPAALERLLTEIFG